MNDQDSFSYSNRKYAVIPYDTDWQKRFTDEASVIRNIFNDDIQIEHVGSTAVLGMDGKPCIDVLVIPENLETVKQHIDDMENAGYVYRGAFVREDALLFTKIKEGELQANIHFFSKGHPHIPEMLILRDYLRNDPEEVARYSSFKKELYKKYSNDYGRYRKEKDEYMEKLKDRARNK